MIKIAWPVLSKKTYGLLTGFLAVVTVLSLQLANSPVANAAADVCTWTGSGADSNMSTAGNWTGCDNGDVPENGDDVVFPSGPTNKTVTINDRFFLANATFSGNNYIVNTTDQSLNQLFIDSNLTISGNNTTFNADVRFFNYTGVTLTHSGSGTVFSNYIVIQPVNNGADVNLDIQTGMSVPMIAQTGGSVGLISKTGNGTLDVTGDAIVGMTADDGIDISAGRWKCDTANCLGNDNNVINVTGSGTIEFAGAATINVGSITGDGTIAFTNANAITHIGSNNTSGTFSGTVEGYTNSQLQITGGVWTFSGYNTDVGDGFSSYYVNGGKFVANAADVSLGMSPFSVSSGILGGTGVIGPVAVYGGTVAPGNSPGCLYPNGDFAFADENSTLSVQISNTTECTGYDVLNADGDVFLNNATLSLEILGGYVPANGNTFTIVRGSSVNGTFNGLLDGDTITVDGQVFRINYTATTVTLTNIVASSSTSSSSTTLADTGQNTNPLILLSTILLTSGLAVAMYAYNKQKRQNV